MQISGVGMAFIVYLLINILLAIMLIGRPRKPITPGEAVWTLLIDGAIIAAIILGGLK